MLKTILLCLQIALATILLTFVAIGFARLDGDNQAFAKCIELQQEYQKDIQEGLVEFRCRQRQWWQFHTKFGSPAEDLQIATDKTNQLEKSREIETENLRARSTNLIDNINNLTLQQNYADVEVSNLKYRKLEETILNLEERYSQVWKKYNQQMDFIANKKSFYTVANPSEEFSKLFTEIRKKSPDQQAEAYPEFVEKWEEEKATWADKLYTNSKFANSLTKEEFTEMFETLKVFSGKDFVEVGDLATLHPNKNSDSIIPQVFETSEANEYAWNLAKKQGYTFRFEYEGELVEYQNQQLPPQVFTAYKQLEEAAKKDGFALQLTSVFRSVDDQKDLFLQRFTGNSTVFGGPFSAQQIVGGRADSTFTETFKMTAFPGASKHHTGLAVDFVDSNIDSTVIAFVDTQAYQWLKENNFLNAKRFGFVPSYPEGVQNMGPEPESWEYIYVGRESLMRQP